MYEAWAPQYDILSAASWRSTTNRYQKYFQLIVDTIFVVVLCLAETILYENGSQYLEIYQENGPRMFLPQQPLVRNTQFSFRQ